MATAVQKARCVYCRTDVSVPDTYAHGDHIKCATCGTRHKVQRGDVLKLVIADVAPLREALRANEQLIERLEDEMRKVRRNIGIGANGLWLGIGFAVWQVVLNEQPIDFDLAWQTVAVALAAGFALELLNFLFLSKRRAISRLGAELEEARAEGRQLQQKIRDASRG
jgi:hypothetical protein